MATSVTVDPLTLRYLNTIKGLMEYNAGRKYTLNDTILICAAQYDWYQSKYVSKTTKLNPREYFLKRSKIILDDLSDKDIKEFIKIQEKF